MNDDELNKLDLAPDADEPGDTQIPADMEDLVTQDLENVETDEVDEEPPDDDS